jgi:REP element-mobilizing transposase RayT
MYLSNYGRIVNECWQKIPDHFPQIVLHEYVIMPNHVHGIIEMHNNTNTNIVNESIVGAAVGANTTGMCADTTGVGANDYSPLQTTQFRPHGTSCTVGSVVRGFKIGVTRQMGFSPWQRNYYEHIIRNNESYQYIVKYIAQNPMKWEEDCFYYGINGTAI